MRCIYSTYLFLVVAFNSFIFSNVSAQTTYTRKDTLRGTLSTLRLCYDVTFYHLNIQVFPLKQSITGYNAISFQAVTDFDSLQVDLFANLQIDSIVFEKKHLSYRRDGNAVLIQLQAKREERKSFRIFYHGKPIRAVNPPWDGGFVWEKDINNKDWIGVACQGLGASCWWPCKDHQIDKPDSMHITITYPKGLMCVCNGQKGKETHSEQWNTVTWRVTYPINNYNVTLNIADYAHFSDTCMSGGKKLSLDYYVLKYNLDIARLHFKQVPVILGCYENYFGAYPFIRDGYKLVETSYWGMEHQSCISYGNAYLNTSLGFDYIILHETAHEWWGNQLTAADNADMWLHEGFGTYAEALYVECKFSIEAAQKYMTDMRWQVMNQYPIVGPYGVNYQGIKNDNDMYYKGAWTIYTFRSMLNNDQLFFSWLKALLEHFKFKPTSTKEFIQFTDEYFSKDYTAFFQQYLFYKDLPQVQYAFEGDKIKAKIISSVDDLTLPISFLVNGKVYKVPVGKEPVVVYNGKYKRNTAVVDDSQMLIRKQQVKKL